MARATERFQKKVTFVRKVWLFNLLYGNFLCLSGECRHCLVAVDGVASVGSCKVTARGGK
ncbi:MAG: 2Fe-2S iron-sulfur cluster-binding protein [Blastocatellia bacterium]